VSGDPSSNLLKLVPLGIPTLIIADDPQLIAAARAAYAHWCAAAPASEPQIELRLAIGRASTERVSLAIALEGSCLQLAGNGIRGTADAATRKASATISLEIAKDAARFADVCDTLLLFILARNGRTPVHAAAFLLGDLAIVLAGPSGSGKSTLALAAAERGYPVLSDDTVFVQCEPRFRLWGFPRPIHVYPEDAPAGEYPIRSRAGKFKAALPVDAPALSADQAALVLLDWGTDIALSPADPAQAVEALMNLDAGFDLLEAESRAALEALASAGAWRLTLTSDPAAAVAALSDGFAAPQ
jgi:hypothetical protein